MVNDGGNQHAPRHYDSPEWRAWFERHPDHHVYGAMIAHPMGCGRRCLDDSPSLSHQARKAAT